MRFFVSAQPWPDEGARKCFSGEELVNLTLAIVAVNGWNRLLIALGFIGDVVVRDQVKGELCFLISALTLSPFGPTCARRPCISWNSAKM